jgi:hypothetical protein
MKAAQRAITTIELLLISPAVLFMTALFMRNVQPQQYEPAHTAQQIVMWYAARQLTGLWLLLIALPVGVLVTGCAMVWRRWESDAELRKAARDLLTIARTHLATILTTGATVTAAGILGIVALHVLAD